MRVFCVVSFFLISSCSFNKILSQESKFFISMKRTACYGTCPQYTIKIHDDGYMTYNGKMFVDKIGCHSTYLSKSKMNNVKELLDDIDYFSLQKIYDSGVTDIPSVITEVSLNKKNHKVINRFNGPKKLKKLYDLLDSIVLSTINWEQCDSLN